MIANVLALLLLGPVTVNVNAKDGELISGERTFRVTVQADNPVTQVEFYVGDDLRETDTSTPYEFKLTALDESDGDLKLTFAAYTSEGESAKKALKVKVDNGISKGAEFHIERGKTLLSDGKWDDAIMAGRVALKAQPSSVGAKMLLARAYFAKGVYDQAQKFAEDVAAAEPNNLDAMDLVGGINLQRAFTTFNRGGEKKETIEVIRGALKIAAENRRKTLEAQLDQVGAPTDENRLRYADAAIRAMRFSSAANALQAAFQKDPANNAVSNRLAYAQLRSGRIADAKLTLGSTKRRGALDAYGNALAAVIEASEGNDSASEEALKEAILSDSEDMGVRTAQVYVALKQGKLNAMKDLANGLARDAGSRSEVNYYLATVLNATQQYSDSQKRFEMAVLSDPANYPMYIERANQALALVSSQRVTDKDTVAYQFLVASAFFEAALAAKPDSPEALTGMAIASLLQARPADSVRYAKSATAAGPTYAAGFYVYACVSSLMQDELLAKASKIRTDARGNLDAEQKAEIAKYENESKNFRSEVQKAREKAEVLDKNNLSGRPVPVALDAFTYYYRHGRLPVLTAPK